MSSPEVVYTFGEAELDTARHRLAVRGVPVDVEPKAFAVLQDLLAHAGALRSRDDLLDAVWGHRHVTPAVLNRCVGQLRKALDDHAEAPRYIQTVHALGYRLVAPVDVREAAPSPIAHAVAKPRVRRAHWWIAGVAAALLVAWVALPRRAIDSASPVGDVVARAPSRVSIVTFTLPAGAGDLQPQVRALEATLAQGLASPPGLRVERGAAPPAADAVRVTGALSRQADAWRLQVRVVDPTSRTPWTQAYPFALADLGRTSATIQADLLRAIRPDSAAALDGGKAASAADFLRSGERAAKGLQQRDRRDAIENFQRALALDPGNAEAWCKLGGMYLLRADENLDAVETVLPAASDAIAHGLRIEPASSGCLQAKGQLLRLQGDIDGAARSFRRALALDPQLFSAAFWLAQIEGDRLHFTRFRTQLEALVARHPERGWPHYMLVNAYEMTGEPEAARAFARVAAQRHPSLRDVAWVPGSVELNYGRVADGIRHYQRMSAFDPDDRSYHLVASFWAAEILATDVAKSELDQAGVIDTVHYPLAHVWLSYALGDPEGALAWLRAAKLPPSSALVQRGWQAQSLALMGRRDEALAEYARVFEGGYADRDPTMETLGAWTYSAQLLNYAALLPAGAQRDDVVAAGTHHLARLRADGLGLPWVHYQAAQLAVLRGDVDAGMREMDRALDAGYADALSLYRDLAWKPLAGDARFVQRKVRLEAIAAAQRRALATPVVAKR
jgi:DNA-binding winged helix-turn-helix (wHTH) protein/tetratricopeptide (TPR) repeat protein